jgi:serine phosphatase RsbU (regulator of sigma subunit)
MLSDGVVEATGPDGEAFGEARLAHSIASPRSEDLIARLRAASPPTSPARQPDDISILVIDCPA